VDWERPTIKKMKYEMETEVSSLGKSSRTKNLEKGGVLKEGGDEKFRRRSLRRSLYTNEWFREGNRQEGKCQKAGGRGCSS